MGQVALGDLVGCGLLLLVPLILLLVAFWPFVLAGAALLLAVSIARQQLQRQRFEQLRTLTRTAERWLVGDVCLMEGRHGRIEALALEGPLSRPLLRLELACLAPEGSEGIPRQRERIPLTPPASLTALGSHAGFRRFLASQGIRGINDLAVEARALRTALDCEAELEWSGQALQRLDAMLAAVEQSLARAEGNELLEGAVPAMQRARRTFTREQTALRQHWQEAATLLRKLRDFLAVPEALRPVLSDDLDNLIDPQRRQDLQRSFQEVVALNDAYRELAGGLEPPPAPPRPSAGDSA
ncbi:MAG: hypothetical protein VKK62_09240 [Synechococcaceae cyanobacterium]|nr:hypothetical protein [Synechococcaceae cyanobacterium]